MSPQNEFLKTDEGVLIPHHLFEEMRKWEQQALNLGKELAAKNTKLQASNEALNKRLNACKSEISVLGKALKTSAEKLAEVLRTNEEFKEKLLELNTEILDLTLKGERLEAENKKLRERKKNFTKRKLDDYFHQEGSPL